MSFLILLQLLAADPVFHLHELPFTHASGEGPRKDLPGTMPGGVAILDFDGDGLPDLFFANGAELPSLSKSTPLFYNRLYRNLRPRPTTMATASPTLPSSASASSTSTAISAMGKFSFSELPNQSRWAYTSHWAGPDNDGDLDLLVVNCVKWSPALDRECLVEGEPD